MKTSLLAILTLTLTTAALTIGPLQSTEPSYRNKKLTAWLDDLDTLDLAQWTQAAEAVRAIGTNALPTLANQLRAKDSLFRRRLIDLCETYPVIVLTPAEARHETALEACRILGPAASLLTPEIVRFFSNNRRTKAVKVLVAIGDRATEPLEKVLAGGDESARAGAAVALGSIARQPQSAVAALTDRLQDSKAETRMAAAWALGRFGASAKSAAAKLSLLTNDSAANVREQAKVALDRIAWDAPTFASAPK